MLSSSAVFPPLLLLRQQLQRNCGTIARWRVDRVFVRCARATVSTHNALAAECLTRNDSVFSQRASP